MEERQNLAPEFGWGDQARLQASGPSIMLKRGQTLFEVGAPVDGCYWLTEGVLKVSVISDHGAERILSLLGAGSLVGASEIIDGTTRYRSVSALKESALTFIPRRTFLECLSESPSLSAFLTQTLVARLRQTEEDVTAASFLSLRSRIARALLEFTRYIGVPMALPDHFVIRELRQEDIAARASVARENVSRILSEWRRDKLIVPQTPSVYVILKSQLEREASIRK